MTKHLATCVSFAFITGMLVVACGDKENSPPAEDRSQPLRFIPGKYRAEIIEIESDCNPPLEDIIAATEQPKDGIVQLIWRDPEGTPIPTPEAAFWFAHPRMGRDFLGFTLIRGEPSGPGRRTFSFFPGEQVHERFSIVSSLTCYKPLDGDFGPVPEVKVTQGATEGVLEAEIIHQWPDTEVEDPGCLTSESYPRRACTERFVTRYTLVRECPLNCTAWGSGEAETTLDIFPDVYGNYRDFTFPDELYQCVPFESPDPLLGGACPEEFIVRGGEADVQREPND